MEPQEVLTVFKNAEHKYLVENCLAEIFPAREDGHLFLDSITEKPFSFQEINLDLIETAAKTINTTGIGSEEEIKARQYINFSLPGITEKKTFYDIVTTNISKTKIHTPNPNKLQFIENQIVRDGIKINLFKSIANFYDFFNQPLFTYIELASQVTKYSNILKKRGVSHDELLEKIDKTPKDKDLNKIVIDINSFYVKEGKRLFPEQQKQSLLSGRIYLN